MILGIEVGMFIVGVYTLATGRLNLWTGRNVYGRPARLLGLLTMAPLVFALSVGVAIGVASGGQGAGESLWILELAVAIAAMAGIYVIGWPLSQSHAPGGARPKDALRRPPMRR